MTKAVPVPCLVRAVMLLAAAAPAVAGQDLPRGSVIEKVVCQGDATESYALYLPAAYSPARKWPILYALDPAARGERPVQRFKDAAEALGVIVAGSNNSRNGPLEVSDRALSALLADTRARFSLDPRRVYLTGFSGGARTAVMAGLSPALKGLVAGIIGFGAGFPPPLTPTRDIAFAYFGGIGTEDFNYPEMIALDRTLGGLGLAHRLEVFDGGHEWPPASVCAHALEWMDLQALRRGLRAKDPALVESIFSRSMEEASTQEKEQPYLAFLRYRALADDFAGLHDVSACDALARALERSREVEQARVVLEQSVGRQRELEMRVQRLVAEALGDVDDPLHSAIQLRAEMALVRQQSEASRRPAERIVARRVLVSTWILLRENAAGDTQRGRFERAAATLSLLTQLRPESAQAEYDLARARVRAGDRRGAIAALGRAVAKGFADAGLLEKEPDFEPLRGEAAFGDLVRKLRDPSTR